jgi:uncharacterized iron-regulated protein
MPSVSLKAIPMWLMVGTIAMVGLGRAATPQPATLDAVLNQYATIVHASYEDAYTSAMALRTALQTLVALPRHAAGGEIRLETGSDSLWPNGSLPILRRPH